MGFRDMEDGNWDAKILYYSTDIVSGISNTALFVIITLLVIQFNIEEPQLIHTL